MAFRNFLELDPKVSARPSSLELYSHLLRWFGLTPRIADEKTDALILKDLFHPAGDQSIRDNYNLATCLNVLLRNRESEIQREFHQKIQRRSKEFQETFKFEQMLNSKIIIFIPSASNTGVKLGNGLHQMTSTFEN